jgi:hypothetical protein
MHFFGEGEMQRSFAALRMTKLVEAIAHPLISISYLYYLLYQPRPPYTDTVFDFILRASSAG